MADRTDRTTEEMREELSEVDEQIERARSTARENVEGVGPPDRKPLFEDAEEHPDDEAPETPAPPG